MLRGTSVIILSEKSVTEALQEYVQKHMAPNVAVVVKDWRVEDKFDGPSPTRITAVSFDDATEKLVTK